MNTQTIILIVIAIAAVVFAAVMYVQKERTRRLRGKFARVVDNYRSAHAIAERDAAGQANTEDLRQAMVHYRALFEDLLMATEVHETTHHFEEVRR